MTYTMKEAGIMPDFEVKEEQLPRNRKNGCWKNF